MSDIKRMGDKINENMQLQEFVERILSYTFNLAQYGELFVDDICDDMGITEEEMYQMYNELGYEKDIL